MAQRGTDVSEKETEYVPKSQPQGVSIKVYAKENVFPEGTTMTVKELTNKELDSAQNVLEKGNVSYDEMCIRDRREYQTLFLIGGRFRRMPFLP